MAAGAIQPAPVLEASPKVLAEARYRCAARAAARGLDAEAQRYRDGANDHAWAMRYEVEMVRKEQAAAREGQG